MFDKVFRATGLDGRGMSMSPAELCTVESNTPHKNVQDRDLLYFKPRKIIGIQERVRE